MDSEHAPGVFDSFRCVGGVALQSAKTRLEIALTDLEEEKIRLEERVCLAVGAVFFLGLGVVGLTTWLIFLLWPTFGAGGVAIFAAFYLGLGVYLGALLQNKSKTRPRPFDSTLREFDKDYAAYCHLANLHEPHEVEATPS
jgi:uncharacterized membrane protein YqjE